MTDEKSVKESPKPTPPSPSDKGPAPSAAVPAGTGFARLATAWSVLCAFAWGATVYCLPNSGTWFWRPLTEIGSLPIRPMLLAGIAAGAFVAWLLVVKHKARLVYLKPGQGTWVRVTGYVGVFVVVLFAAYEIAILPPETSEWWRAVYQISPTLTVRLSWFPAAALTTALMIAYHVFMNREAWSEFMIETQSELRKVNWPATKEWVGSSAVVLVVVVVVSCFLALVDEGLTKVMTQLGIGF